MFGDEKVARHAGRWLEKWSVNGLEAGHTERNYQVAFAEEIWGYVGDADLLRLLGEGKTYYWALRQGLEPGLAEGRIREIRKQFERDGIDATTLAALRQLEYSIARFTQPRAIKSVHTEYLYFPIAAFDLELYFNELITEHGLELGIELFPSRFEWTFGHPEIQYCTGGDTAWDLRDVDGTERTVTIRPGDVGAYPAGTNFTCASQEGSGSYGHAHIFLLNIGEAEGQVFYDQPAVIRLQALGILPAETRPELHDLTERIEVTDWSELVSPQTGRERDLPTWLRKGWARREEARALDYGEGTRRSVISSPDRRPEDYLEWGSGSWRCYVNPLVAEQTAAITDCRFPVGYARALPKRELWVVLSGEARVRQSVPIFHSEWLEADVGSGWVMSVGAGAHVRVEDASDDFVVRRMAETCAHNGHALMMDRKLELDGIAAEA